ncbi:alternative oxidase, partial [Rhodotorula sp. JG-1b]
DWVLAHPVYTQEELDAIQIVERPPENMTDRLAKWMVKAARAGFDLVTGYKARRHCRIRSIAELQKEGYLMTEKQWMARILESIAGVPGFTAAMLRHLHSLRLMRRDGGWIRTLLEEAENERMHLLTFMKIRQPGYFFRFMVLVAQGVFTNLFFFTYLIYPKACHRFVGYLVPVKTYTHVLEAIKRGEIPEWAPGGEAKVPQVAKDFWRLPDDAQMIDLIRVVRADEAGHRFVNHSLANLRRDDFNPVAMVHQSAKLQGTKPGFTREESLEWARMVQEQMTGHKMLEAPASEEAKK